MPDARFELSTLGEMMLRLSVPAGERLETVTRLDVHPAGAESNVASLLARLGRRTCWAGALPRNPLGRRAADALRMSGVDLGGVVWREDGRMGTYYVEFGAPPRGIQVTYDRAGSCATELRPQDVDWEALLDTRLLHLTGITPALSPSCREVTLEALRRAKERGVPVSFDVNYRSRLWAESEAREALLPMIRGVEVLFCSAADAARVFGFHGDAETAAQAMLELSRAHSAVVTFGDQGALLWDGKAWQHEPARATQIVDRLGAGDALAAGVIHGWLQGDTSPSLSAGLAAGLRYGVTLAALALSQLGDMVVTDRQELERLSKGGAELTR